MLFLSLFACAPINPRIPVGRSWSRPTARVWLLSRPANGWSLFSDVQVPADRGCGDLSDLQAVTFNGEPRCPAVAARKVDGECEGPQASVDLADFEGELTVEWVADSGTRTLVVEAATGPTNLRLSSPENGIVDAEQDIVVSWDSVRPRMEEIRVIGQGPDGVVHMFDGDSTGHRLCDLRSPHQRRDRAAWSSTVGTGTPSITSCPEGWSCEVWDAVWDGADVRCRCPSSPGALLVEALAEALKAELAQDRNAGLAGIVAQPDKVGLALDVLDGDAVPSARVAAVVSVVAHGEDLAFRHLVGAEVGQGAGKGWCPVDVVVDSSPICSLKCLALLDWQRLFRKFSGPT